MCVGLIIDKMKEPIRVNINHFEDYEFCCRHFLRDGGILRFNDIGLKSNFYNKKGGICATYNGLENRLLDGAVVAEYLKKEYPKMCSIIKNKKRNCVNIRLNHHFNC